MASSIPTWALTEHRDWEEGHKEYRRRRAREYNEGQIRQAIRGERVEEIEAASVEADGTILGEPWFSAWLTMAAFLAGEGRFKEILPPREWLAEKLRSSV